MFRSDMRALTQPEDEEARDGADLEPLTGEARRHVTVRVQPRLAAFVGAAARDAEWDAASEYEHSKDNYRRHDADIAHSNIRADRDGCIPVE